MGRTRPRSVGWASPGPKPNGLVTVHQHSNQPLHHLLQNVNYSRSACKCRQGLSKRKQNGAAGGYLGRQRCGAVRCCWRRWCCCRGGGTAVAGGVAPSSSSPSSFFFSSFFLSVFRPFSRFFFSFFSFGPLPSPLVFSSPLFFSLIFFFFPFFLCFPSLLPLFFSFLSLSRFFRSFFPLFFRVSCLPCIYRGEKETYTPAQSMAQRCRVDGAATVQPPLYHPRDTSPPLTLTRGKLCRWRVPGRRLVGSSGEGKAVRNRGEKIFFFPCFARPGEEEDPQCLQNGAVSAPFF